MAAHSTSPALKLGPSGRQTAGLDASTRAVTATVPPSTPTTAASTGRRARGGRADHLRQSAAFAELGEVLPPLLDDLQAALAASTGSDRMLVLELMTEACHAARAMLKKLGYLDLAWVAVERAAWAAHQRGDPLLLAANSWNRLEVYAASGATTAALRLALKTIADLDTGDRVHMAEAERAAALLGGDRNDYQTMFGPRDAPWPQDAQPACGRLQAAHPQRPGLGAGAHGRGHARQRTYLASLGAGSLLFQHVFGFAAMDYSVPLMGFVFLVALGVDYNIFLMTRVREEAAERGHRRGVLAGLQGTGGVITSAGIVLAATFSVLGVMPLVFMVEIGVLVALGVLVDTLVVRSIVVPALALELGRATWWPSQAPSRIRAQPELGPGCVGRRSSGRREIRRPGAPDPAAAPRTQRATRGG